MRKSFLSLLGLCSIALTTAHAVPDVQIDIPYKKFVLTNGLTLLVHEDHKAPIIAVNTWYHVGSKNEKPGKTGFAHLFEHMMFTGSENMKGGGDQKAFFAAMEKIGATDLNGTTSEDRTDFFENVPSNALDIALWMESDRMGHLLGAVTQPKLDEQRGVVQNEKRQGENQPYGVTRELITKGTAPVGHPYSWTVIGSMDDLNAASLDDVHKWFQTYYGAANAVIVLAGDIDPETALKKVEHYYGSIPSGPPVAKYQEWIPKIPGVRRQIVSDRVPQARLYKIWNVPRYGEKDNVLLDLAGDVLASGKTSPLYKRLVYDEQICTDISAGVDTGEISSLFEIIATAKPGGDLAKIERAIDEEVAKFLAKGPSQKELDRIKAGDLASFVRGAERIGGFGGKSDLLAMNETYRGSADFYKTNLQYYRDATTTDVKSAAQRWLGGDLYILEVHPYPTYATNNTVVDRANLPVTGAPPEVKFPALQKAALSNGLKIILAERHATPLISFNLLVDAGYAADQFASPGTAKLAMSMLDEGTKHRTSLQISDELGNLGASIGAGSDLDSSAVNLSTLAATLDPALDIYADVILNPSFPAADFTRVQKQTLAAIRQEKNTPFNMALRVFPNLLYGDNHAYGNPFTGTGTEAAVQKMTPTDMQKFHDTWFKPNNSTLVIVGDTTLAAIQPKLEKLFSAWAGGEVPKKNISQVEHPKKSTIYLMDRPDSFQSIILACEVAPPKSVTNEIAMRVMNHVLGGTFTSRLNMNLREEKHWSYGARTYLLSARGQRPFLAYAPVQTDKTSESLVEMEKELRGILGKRPVNEEEVKQAQDNQTLKLPGSWETIGAVSGSITELVNFHLPDDYITTFPDKIRALTVNNIVQAAEDVVHPDQLVWIVVGDRAKIEPGIKKLGWGKIQLLDADGKPVK